MDDAAHTTRRPQDTLACEMTDLPDVELLDGWARGCRQSGQILIERHIHAVHRFFRNKVNPTHAEDLVQQTFLALLEAHASYRCEGRFRTWMMGIARYQLFAHFRRTRWRADGEFDPGAVRDERTSTTGLLAKHANQCSLLRALQGLPIEDQIILELAYWEDFSGADIAATLQVPLQTGYSRLHRARQALRLSLARHAPELTRGDDPLVQFDAWAHDLRQNRLDQPRREHSRDSSPDLSGPT